MQAGSLSDFYNQALESGRIVDVSNISVNSGSGARLVNRPVTGRSTLYWDPMVPIGSRSFPHYIAAIQLLFGNQGIVDNEGLIREAANKLGTVSPITDRFPTAVSPRIPSPTATYQLGAIKTVPRIPSPTRAASPFATLPRIPSPIRVASHTDTLPRIPSSTATLPRVPSPKATLPRIPSPTRVASPFAKLPRIPSATAVPFPMGTVAPGVTERGTDL